MKQTLRFEKIIDHLGLLIDEGIMNDEIRDLLTDARLNVISAETLHKQTVEKVIFGKEAAR